jgi:hypothetical protein
LRMEGNIPAYLGIPSANQAPMAYNKGDWMRTVLIWALVLLFCLCFYINLR